MSNLGMSLEELSRTTLWKSLDSISKRLLSDYIEGGATGEKLLSQIIVAHRLSSRESPVENAHKFLARAEIQRLLSLHENGEI